MEQAGFFSSAEMADMSWGLVPPVPTDYKLPTQFPSLKNAARIAIDAEGNDPLIASKGAGVYRKDGYVCGLNIAAWDKHDVLMHAEYYPFRHRCGTNLDEESVWQYVKDNLNNFEGELVGANVALYDGDWLQSYGVRPAKAKWRDVQWAEALIDEMAPNYKLDTIAKKYCGFGKVTSHLKQLYGDDYIKRFHEVHPGHARTYGLGDVLPLNDILIAQYKELKSLRMMKLFDMESRLVPFLLYLRENGVRVDMERAERFQNVLQGKRADCLAEASRISGVELTPDNFTTPKVRAYVLDKLGIRFPKTKEGKPSITDKWLEHLAHPIGKSLLGADKYNKAKETFIDGYVFDFAVDGRIHGEFHPLRRSDDDFSGGTESGRFSGSHPNLQNIPARDEELGPLCRSMFVPERGAKWWSYDYSQIEYRMLVHFAVLHKCKGSEIAQAMYAKNPDTDFHQAVAELTGLKRKDAKNLNFGLVYGMGVPLLAKNLNLLDEKGEPKKEALEIMETYHSKAPFIKALYNLCSESAQDRGEVRTILNRRSQFEFYEPSFTKKGSLKQTALPFEQAVNTYGFAIRRAYTHKALNRLLQGSAADLMKAAMVRAFEAGVFTSTSDFTCSLTVHDELDGSLFPTNRGEECYKELKNIMQTVIPLHVPVLVGAGIGDDWSEAK